MLGRDAAARGTVARRVTRPGAEIRRNVLCPNMKTLTDLLWQRGGVEIVLRTYA